MSENLHHPAPPTDELPPFNIHNAQVSPFAEFSQTVPENLALFRDLTSPVGIDSMKKSIQDELSDSEMVHISRSEDRALDLNSQAFASQDIETAKKLDDSNKRIRKEQLRLFGPKKVERFNQLKHMQHYIESNGSLLVLGDEATTLARLFLDPEKSHKNSNGVFIKEMSNATVGKKGINIGMPIDSDPIDIPLSSVVSAAGFESWEGRGDQTSKDKIVKYSQLDTPIPPIRELYAYILPDGSTVYETANSHRVAAARLKGQDTIPFKGVLYINELGYMPYVLKSN